MARARERQRVNALPRYEAFEALADLVENPPQHIMTLTIETIGRRRWIKGFGSTHVANLLADAGLYISPMKQIGALTDRQRETFARHLRVRAERDRQRRFGSAA